jgi:WD40-like Beta Propeller Repeat
LWSLDGRFLVIRSNRLGNWGLFGLPVKDGQPAGGPILIKSNIGEPTFLRSMTTEGKLFCGEAVSAGRIAIMKRSEKNELSGSWSLPNIKSPGSRDPNFAPDGTSLVYVTEPSFRLTAQTLRIVTLDGKVLREVSLRPEFQVLQRPVFSPDGKKIALQAHDIKRLQKILVLSAETGALLKVFEFEPESYVAQSGWSKDSQLLYARLNKKESKAVYLEVIDVETEKRTSSPLPGRAFFYPGGVSPDGKLLAPGGSPPSEFGKGHIVLRSLSDGTDKMLEADDLVGSTVWDFDSRHLFYMMKDEKHLCRLSLEDGAKQVLSAELKTPVLQDVSRDGKYLAFWERASDMRIWVVENFLPKARTELAARWFRNRLNRPLERGGLAPLCGGEGTKRRVGTPVSARCTCDGAPAHPP